jgi:hypothetical protein
VSLQRRSDIEGNKDMNTPAIFIDVSCYKLGNRVIMYVSGIDVASVSMIFLFYFGTVPGAW